MANDQKTISASAASKSKSEVTVKVGSKAAAKAKAKARTGTAAGAKVAPAKTKMDRPPVAQSGKNVAKTPQQRSTKVEPVAVKAQGDETQPEVAKKQDGKSKKKLTKKQIGIICGVVAVLVVALVLVLVLVCGGKKSETDEANDTETTQDEQEVDYDQKVTSEDGGTFKAEYQAGSEKSFAVRFADLQCEDGCKNVSEVRLGKKTLKQDEDYEVKKGSIIIILTEDFMESLKTGKHELIIAVVDGDETKLYGVKFTVKAAPTCEEDEEVKDGECVKKEAEEEEDDVDENQETTTSQTTQPVSEKSKAEIECENTPGPTGFYAVHWFSNDEMGDSVFSGNAITMHRVNGVCQPYMAQVTDWTGRGFPETGGWSVSASAGQEILDNIGQDFIMWYWGDGSTTLEKVTDARKVWSY